MRRRRIEDLWQALQDTEDLPRGLGQIRAVEQILPRADASGDAHLRFATRLSVVHAAVFGGEPMKAFAPFAWCVAEVDARRRSYHDDHEYELFWLFKSVASSLLEFPEVPLERAVAVVDDMERRYREAGHSPHAVHSQRHKIARHLGDTAAAEQWYRLWVTSPRDELSDCEGCEPTVRAAHLARTDRDEEAVALAEPVLAEVLTCHAQPQSLLTRLLLPYLRTGRHDAAAEAHRRAYRLLRADLFELESIGTHIEFCVLTGNELRGLEILERHLPWLDRAPSPMAAMRFAASGALVLRRLAGPHPELVLHRPAHGDRPAGEVGVGELAAELAETATAVAARFDARNGTSWQGDRVAALLAAEPLVELSLSATARRRHVGPVAASPSGSTAAASAPEGGVASAAPSTVPQVPAVPADVSAEELLDLIEGWVRGYWFDAVAAGCRAFAERFAGAELSGRSAARWAVGRGAAADMDGDLDAALAAAQEALDRYREAGDPVGERVSESRIGRASAARGEVAAGLATIDAAIAALMDLDARDEVAAAHLRRASVLHAQERWAEELSTVEAAAGWADDPCRLAETELARALCLQMLDRRTEAAAIAALARDRFREAGASQWQAVASMCLADCRDDPAEVLAAHDDAVAVAAGRLAVDARVGRARALREAGRPAQAIDDYVEAVAVCAEFGLDEGGARVGLELADAYAEDNRWLLAAEVAEQARAQCDRRADRDGSIIARTVLVGVHRALDEPAAALTALDELIALLGDDGDPAELGRAHEDAADLLFHRDDDAAAALRFATAAERYRRADDPLGELRALRRTASAWSWADEPEMAMAALTDADRVAAALPAQVLAEPDADRERAVLRLEAAGVLMRSGRSADALGRSAGTAELLRSIGAEYEAVDADLTHAQILLELGRADEAEPLLAVTLAGMPRDADAVPRVAWLLGRAWDELGRADEAAALRAEHGLPED